MTTTDDPGDPAHRPGGVSRRAALGLGATAAGAAGLGVLGVLGVQAAANTGHDAPRPSGTPTSPPPTPTADVELITLGTKAGPPPSWDRVGISSALVVHGKAYVIDCGRSSVTQFAEAGLHFADLAGIFLTHLHADHVADYYNYFMLGGWARNNGAGLPKVPVYGPGPAGGLPPARTGGGSATVGPDATPGIQQLTEAAIAAYAYSTNIFIRDAGIADPHDLMAVHEITLPADVHASYQDTAPDMQPFRVFEDDAVSVTAILVPHYDVFPSFAFRFDIDGGQSVVFSGDTVQSDNVARLAAGCDLLVHESAYQLSDVYLQKSHTSPQQVGSVATAAGARRVVLSHITPADLPDEKWTSAVASTYRGPVTVAADLQRFPLTS